MADTRFQTQVRNQSRAEIDQGLRSYMLGVYNYMALGVALTAIITLAVAASPAAMPTSRLARKSPTAKYQRRSIVPLPFVVECRVPPMGLLV